MFISAFFSAYIMSSFTSEMSRMQKRDSKRDQILDYAKYSLYIHKIPDKIGNRINHFINFKSENDDQLIYKYELMELINPALNMLM